MVIKHYRLYFLIGLALLGLETAVQFRGQLRGWDTFLFSWMDRQPTAASAKKDQDPFPFRSPRVSPEKPAGVSRVWLGSSSYGEDIYQPMEIIFPVRAGDKLNEKGKKVQVLNASKAGNTIRSNIHDLESLAPIWTPDVAVLYQFSNDINDLASKDSPEPPAQKKKSRFWTPQRFVEYWSLYEILKIKVTPFLTEQRPLENRLPPEKQKWIEDRVKGFVQAAREAGAKPVLCTFAARYDESNVDQFDRGVFHAILRYNPILSREGWVNSIADLNAWLRGYAGDNNIPLVDMAQELGGQAELFRDYIHFTPEGHERAAEVLAEGLARVIE